MVILQEACNPLRLIIANGLYPKNTILHVVFLFWSSKAKCKSG